MPRGGGPDGQSPFLVRKGVGLGWSTYHLHRNKDIYGHDACNFQPSRWEDGELSKKAGIGGFLDFHAGPRVCLGSEYRPFVSKRPDSVLTHPTEDYALMESSYAIIRILQRYPGIRLPPGVPNESTGKERQHLGIVLTSAEGTKVMLK